MKHILFACLVCLCGGCTAIHVERTPSVDEAGTLSLMALEHRDTPAKDYSLVVERKGKSLGRFENGGTLQGLAPGRYIVRIRGRGIEPKEVTLRLYRGEKTTFRFFASHARRLARYEATLDDVIAFIGKALLYTAGVALVIFSVLVDAWSDDEDEEEDDDGCRPSRPQCRPCWSHGGA
jgi:hypothetical protein